jgi:hypothetical protein
MLPAITALASDLAHPTAATMAAADRFLRYAAAYPDNALVFSASDMILFGQSDASFNSRSHARSVGGGFFFCGNKDSPTTLNGALLAFSSILDVVCGSVAEAEYGSLFLCAQNASWLRSVLLALGHPQPPTLILCDNACAVGLANETLKVKRSKSIDLRFHWIRDRIRQNEIQVSWIAGKSNVADFFTKPLPVHEHQRYLRLLVTSPLRQSSPGLRSSVRRAISHSRALPSST